MNTELEHKKAELQFLEIALINLELVQVAQEDQKHFGWIRFTSDTIRELKMRAESLRVQIANS